MMNYRLISVESGIIRNSEVEYGIIPMPKLYATDTYKTHAQVETLLYCIPYSRAEDLDRLGMFLECFASESYNTVKPAYYEIALTSKYVQDEESVGMLNKIITSVAIDPINLYCWNFSFTAESVRSMYQSRVNSITSLIEKNSKKTVSMANKLNGKYETVTQNHAK